MYIDYADIPSYQNLFLDYLQEYDNVSRFFSKNFRNKEKYPAYFTAFEAQKRQNRNQLSELIAGQYSDYTVSQQTQKNIEILRSGKTFTVVTGQQLGLFGGPMYTFYKIITAIKLSRYLKEQYDEYNFVPLFWLEGDDHDFDEVRSVSLLGKDNTLKKILYSDDREENENRGSVGNLELGEDLFNVFNLLNENLRDSDYKNTLLEFLRSGYSKGKTFRKAFKDLFFKIFDEYGLIIFDPLEPGVKQLLKPVFQKEIENFETHTQSVVKQSAQLEEAYHAQVKVKPVNLFMNYETGRYLIEPVEGEFRLKGKRAKFTKEELLDEINSSPEKFSANVLLRPICQDFLLPTAFYIGGPSEVAYFAQVMPLYEHFDIEPPVIYPRSSATLLESHIKTLLEKFNLKIQDFFPEEVGVSQKVIQELSEINLPGMFSGTKSEVSVLMDRLKETLFGIDKTLSDAAQKTEDRIMQSIDQLAGRAEKAQERTHEDAIRQLDKIANSIYPEGKLQERELSFIYFANKYGIEIFKILMSELSINRTEHQIIEFEL